MCWHGSQRVTHSVNTATAYATIGTFENVGKDYGDTCVLCLIERYSSG